MRNTTRISAVLICLALLLGAGSPVLIGHSAPGAQALSPEERARALLDDLAPEERIGQLFLVHFDGADTGEGTAIYNLIANYHVGGVMLRADRNNIPGPENTPQGVFDLTQNLQEAEWLSTQTIITDTVSGEQLSPAYIPLFIGISQPGDGPPYDQILAGLTQMPSPAAIGATWDMSLSERAGQIKGRELEALGINLLIGPSLDVLESPNPESAGDLGVRTFGGDPYWVGRMGSAYIQGVHAGSADRIAVIGKHFPGVGGSDRPIEEEVSTVRKSLEQLKQIELAPFFYVTGDAPSADATVDGLLISHIRYQGLLGNIRATTRPVSFDEASFNAIMELEPFAGWRESGGVMISDDLGSRAVRRFYDPSGLSFNARLVVRDAFLAGNDLLYLGDILDTGDEDTVTSVIRVLEFFTQKYQEDVEFAQRVDQAVLRILTLKFSLYETFSLDQIVPDPSGLVDLGNGSATVFDIARSGATLISPGFQDLEAQLPDAPSLDDRILFITDTNPYTQCDSCPELESLPIDGLQGTVIRLYGPDAGNQVQRRNLFSYTYADLTALLDGTGGGGLENDLRNADWIVVAMQDVSQTRPDSLAFRRLLSERDDLVREKRLIAFAFNAPYFLDATDISKITAYYALYTKTPEAVEVAARILFKEFVPSLGASPVSVAGIGYDLIAATSPNPEQVIQLMLVSPEIEETDPQLTQEPQAPIQIELGEQITIETSVILDHNGNPVPDGTPVRFVFLVNGIESFTATQISSDGVVRTTYTATEPGALQVTASTEPEAIVTPLDFQIPDDASFQTPESPTPTPETETTAGPTAPVVAPTPIIIEVGGENGEPRIATDLVDWFLSVLVSVSIGLVVYRVGTTAGLVRWSIRWAIAAGIGGMLVYMYLALGFAGTPAAIALGRGAVIWTTAIGALAGWAAAGAWYRITQRGTVVRKQDADEQRAGD